MNGSRLFLKTDNGDHSPQDWAIATADHLIGFDVSKGTTAEYMEAVKLEIAIVDALTPHHDKVQKTERAKLAADAVQLVTGRSRHRVPVRGRGYLTQRAGGRDWRVSLGGFWQVHPGAADVLAAAVLTYMTFWMRKHARSLSKELRARADAALDGRARWGLGLLAFQAVGREGLETVVFTLAIIFSTSTAGALSGAVLARVSNDHAPRQGVLPGRQGFAGPLAPMT